MKDECVNFQGRKRALRLEFIANIVRALTLERRLAPSSLVYIEEVFSHLGGSASSASDIQAILSAFMIVRSALVDRVNEIFNDELSGSRAPCSGATIEYESSFSQQDAATLVSALDDILDDGRGHVALSAFQAGSTILEIDLSAIICSAA